MFRKITIVAVLVSILASCTKDFKTINVDPNNSAKVPLTYLLSQSQLYLGGSAGDPGYATWRANLIYALPATQMFATLGTFYAGDKYLYQADLSEAYFVTQYPQTVKGLVDLINQAQADSVTNVNILAIARILRVLQLSMMTDLYGDVPYSQAGLGYLQKNYSPKYDAQKDIYADMLNQLSAAGTALSATATNPGSADFVYGGDVTKWKHFANSLMLRLAMRMQKVDPTNAALWAKKATDGGVMTSNAETFSIKYANDGGTATINSNSYNLGPAENPPRRNEVANGGIQWSKTLIDMMKARNDPRISTIAILKSGDATAANQKGLPNGLDLPGLTALTGDTDAVKYSRPNPILYSATDPYILLPYAEVEFMKAEAIERGWITGNAATEYAAGQAAAVTQLVVNKGAPDLSGAVGAYQTSNPYPATTLNDKLLQIHSEMFILNASTLNGFEGWANWRRTGLPVLTPTNYPGNATNGTVMRRLIYPVSEQGQNVNYAAAVAAQGADLFTTRMWWDKQ
ncbi:MAG: SusD/RagB family nutrient-binding outer membrane lipoprotein [Chitinophagaceae bacterium]